MAITERDHMNIAERAKKIRRELYSPSGDESELQIIARHLCEVIEHAARVAEAQAVAEMGESAFKDPFNRQGELARRMVANIRELKKENPWQQRADS